MRRQLLAGAAAVGMLGAVTVSVPTAWAAVGCAFTTAGTTMTLDASCVTDTTVVIPQGMTLDGAGHTITAVDPPGGHFLGAVVTNGGSEAHVVNLTVTTDGLANACDAGDDRLRGILLEGASGSVTHSAVLGLNQGPSGCQEGNAIEVRNAPFDGTHPGTTTVEIAHTTVAGYQKTGIVANGDVAVDLHHSAVGASATQANLAANSVQFGFGATGSITHNRIEGNQWMGTSNFAATAVLVFDADGMLISQNRIGGNAEVGIYLLGDGAQVINNKIFDESTDHANALYDIGLGNWGTGNQVLNNKVRGYGTAYDGVDGGGNKTIPSPDQSG